MKVFIYRPHDRSSDCAAIAYDEDGETIGVHVSSSISWAKMDMARHVPEGAEAIWCVGRAALQAHIDAGDLRGVSFGPEATKP